uniref:40S ribosomal protein S21 n=1 Tax=Romanomermis culicivorax TaxID=13658 RepID=A0A915I9H3_ROMCU
NRIIFLNSDRRKGKYQKHQCLSKTVAPCGRVNTAITVMNDLDNKRFVKVDEGVATESINQLRDSRTRE